MWFNEKQTDRQQLIRTIGPNRDKEITSETSGNNFEFNEPDDSCDFKIMFIEYCKNYAFNITKHSSHFSIKWL